MIPLAKPEERAPRSYTEKSYLRAPPKSAGDRFYTIKDFHDAYASGAVTPNDVVEALLPLIVRHGDYTKRSPATAFMESRVELVKRAAEASTQRWAKGQPLGILDGVPFGVKDDLEIEGYKRYIGSTHDYTNGGAKETSWCAKKVEEEGAILVGKLTMHELGMGGYLSHWICVWYTDWSRHNEQQSDLGNTGQPIQHFILHWRLLRRRCIGCCIWPHTFRYWLRWRRLCSNSQQLLRSLRPEAFSRASICSPHARRRKVRHRPRPPSKQHGRPRSFLPRPRPARPLALSLLALQSSSPPHHSSQQNPRHL